MTQAELYRIRAAELKARAKVETDPLLKLEFERLALNYFSLAELAEHNSHTDIVYEPPASAPLKDNEEPTGRL